MKSTIDRLAFYSSHFDTVEVNYSFYHLPRRRTYENWARAVGDDFEFALKASRFITHVKKLHAVTLPWRQFLASAKVLGVKLGPVLFQLPPSLRVNAKRLAAFLELLESDREKTPFQPVFEFRHASWFNDEIYALLEKSRAALCVSHSDRYPCVEVATCGIVYYRFHGPGALFGSRYTEDQMRFWARRMKIHLKEGRAIYAYFNNDARGYAVENGRMLKRYLGFRIHEMLPSRHAE